MFEITPNPVTVYVLLIFAVSFSLYFAYKFWEERNNDIDMEEGNIMTKEEFLKDDEYRHYKAPYVEECDNCGKEHTLYANDNTTYNEYWEQVFLECECGQMIHFSLPAN